MSRKATSYISRHWRQFVFYTVSLAGVVFVLFYKLGTLTNRLSDQEVFAIKRADSWQEILNNPLNFPFKLGELAAHTFAPDSIFWARSVSAAFAVITVVLFYKLMRKWFSARIAYISALLLTTSSWFLQYSRLARPDILLALAVVILLGFAWWVHETKRIGGAAFISVLALGSIMYIPGMVWLIGLGLFTQIKHVRRILRDISLPMQLICLGTIILLLLPLVRAIAFDVNVLKQLIGWPLTFNAVSFLKELVYVPVSLFVRSEPSPIYNLGRLPLLDVFSAAMLILGIYAYTVRFGLVRTKILIAFGIITSLLIALDTPVSIIIIIPVVYAIIAGGLTLLLEQWYTVFPNNPIARSIGTLVLCIAIATTCFYHLNRYFIAWSNSPVTRETFTYKLPDNLLQ